MPVDSSHYNIGEIGSHEVIHLNLSVQGSSRPSAAHISISRAIEAWKPDAIIQVGTGFGIDETKQHIGDVLIADKVADCISEKVSDKGNRFDGSVFDSGRYLLGAFNAYKSTWKHSVNERLSSHKTGLVLSVRGVVDSLVEKQRLLNHWPGAIGGEMEGLGAYAACHDNDFLELIIIKAISDWAVGKDSEAFIENQRLAAKSSVSLVKHVLSTSQAFQNLPINPSRNALAVNEVTPTGPNYFTSTNKAESQGEEIISFKRRDVEGITKWIQILSNTESVMQALFVVDLDGFTNLNKVYGKNVCNRIVKMVQDSITSWCDRMIKTASVHVSGIRSYSDEWFIYLTSEIDRDDEWLDFIGNHLASSIKYSDYSSIVKGAFVTASVGSAKQRQHESEDAHAILLRAFNGLECAKKNGGSMCCLGSEFVNKYDDLWEHLS